MRVARVLPAPAAEKAMLLPRARKKGSSRFPTRKQMRENALRRRRAERIERKMAAVAMRAEELAARAEKAGKQALQGSD